MTAGTKSGPGRRYLLRSGIAMTAYVLTTFIAAYSIRHNLVSSSLEWLLALLPGFAIAGFFYAIGMRIIELKDEYLRMLMVRQLLVATGLSLSLTTTWGLLEQLGLVGHIELYWVMVLWCACLPVGALANRLAYGSWGSCL